MAALFQGFRSVIESSPNAISLVDAAGKILYGSSSNARLFGYRPDELVGRDYLDLLHPDDREKARLALREALDKQPGPLHWEARVQRRDGRCVWTEGMVFSLLAEDAAQAIVVEQRDIDARKAAERERQRHAGELARSKQRLEEFAYTAAHDLRAPVRTISSYAQLLRKRLQTDPDALELTDLILDGATRMSALIQNLLDFASTGIHEPPRPVDLGRALAHAMRDLDLAIKESGAKVIVDPLPVVHGSEIHLIRLFQNLIDNALKYRRADPIEIRISAARDGPNWVVKVKDNGIGIAQADQAKVFIPFARLTDTPGTGLGLAACKNVVEEMGGTIWIESVPGVGSTFFFTIAAVPEDLALSKAFSA